MNFIDTHSHIDGTEFDADRDEMVARAREAGVSRIFVPAIDLPSVDSVLAVAGVIQDMRSPWWDCIRKR